MHTGSRGLAARVHKVAVWRREHSACIRARISVSSTAYSPRLSQRGKVGEQQLTITLSLVAHCRYPVHLWVCGVFCILSIKTFVFHLFSVYLPQS